MGESLVSPESLIPRFLMEIKTLCQKVAAVVVAEGKVSLVKQNVINGQIYAVLWKADWMSYLIIFIVFLLFFFQSSSSV